MLRIGLPVYHLFLSVITCYYIAVSLHYWLNFVMLVGPYNVAGPPIKNLFLSTMLQ